MDKVSLEELLNATPFRVFVIRTNGGKDYEVRNPSLVVQQKTQLFYFFPDSDRFAIIPLRNISAIETVERAA